MGRTKADSMTTKPHKGKTIWFTGLSGSGKTTLSSRLKTILESRGLPVVVLDGDVLRSGLSRDLGFSALDRAENIRRAAETAKILCDAGHTVIAAFITPLESLRRAVRSLFEPEAFVEVFLRCPLEVCEARDPKGLYKRARAGQVPEFTGITSPFELPAHSEIVLSTDLQTPEESLATMLDLLEHRFPDMTRHCTTCGTVLRGLRNRRVLVLGLDGASPSLVFERTRHELPNLHALLEHGMWGPLRSTDPPITIPAWTSMTTGKDPGELGLYGFRNRRDHGYGEMTVATAVDVHQPRVWDYLESHGKTSVLVGIPQTYPPQPHVGITIPGFPGFDGTKMTAYPPKLAGDLASMAGGDYLMDVREFRTDDKDRLLRDLYRMVNRRFRLTNELLTTKPWDFFMTVEIATDRVHHGFWRHCNPDHRLYEQGNPYERVINDFYRYIDSWIGTLLGRLDDDTTVMVVSDHGSKTLTGGVAINEWLIKKGFLSLRWHPNQRTPITPDMIDWSRTKAWSDGGYYARVFLNVKGREPHGTVDQADFEAVREELAQLIQEIPNENGQPMATRILRPQQIYRECTNVPPDLIVYFDDLARRSIGSVGTGQILQSENDTGPDDSNHAMEGIFICARMADLRRGQKINRRIYRASILDIAPTIIDEFGLSVPQDLTGRILTDDQPVRSAVKTGFQGGEAPPLQRVGSSQSTAGFTAPEEEVVKKRLEQLGYL